MKIVRMFCTVHEAIQFAISREYDELNIKRRGDLFELIMTVKEPAETAVKPIQTEVR